MNALDGHDLNPTAECTTDCVRTQEQRLSRFGGFGVLILVTRCPEECAWTRNNGCQQYPLDNSPIAAPCRAPVELNPPRRSHPAVSILYTTLKTAVISPGEEPRLPGKAFILGTKPQCMVVASLVDRRTMAHGNCSHILRYCRVGVGKRAEKCVFSPLVCTLQSFHL